MASLMQELMSPELMAVIYVFVGFIVALYILSVIYTFIDAKRRGADPFWIWGIVSLIPFVGLLVYVVLRPMSYLADREEQMLDMALREHQLNEYGSCPNPVCNTQVRNVCPSCHRPLDANWKVCPYCRTHIQ